MIAQKMYAYGNPKPQNVCLASCITICKFFQQILFFFVQIYKASLPASNSTLGFPVAG